MFVLRGRWFAGLVSALVVVALLGAACGDSDDPDPTPTATPTEVDAAPDPTETAEPTPEATETPEPTPTVETVFPADGVLPRSVAYGGPVWELTDAVVTSQRPADYVAGEDGRVVEQSYVILDFELRNDSTGIGFPSTQARVQLTLADGSVIDGDDVRTTNLPPASSSEARYAFEVPHGTTFEGLSIVIADPGREPSVELPLSGDAPPVEAPQVTELGEAAVVPLPGIEMTWTLEEQHFGRDWPLPFGFRGGALFVGTRSEVDERWLGLTVEVLVEGCDCRGGTLDQAATVRLFVDDAPISPEARDSSRELMNAQTTSDVMLVFAVPAGTLEAELQIGPLDEPDQQVRVPLVLPPTE